MLVDSGRVAAVGTETGTSPDSATTTVDLDDAIVVPGFVDAHTHVTLRPGEGDQDGQCEAPAAWQTIRGVRQPAADARLRRHDRRS